MEDFMVLNELPIELLHVIASHDVKVYHGIALTCKRFSSSFTPSMVVDYKLAFGYGVRIISGCTSWFLNRKLHRDDGPAVEYENGTKEWYVNGKRHRNGGPAVEEIDGTKMWYVNGELHRVDGPAVDRPGLNGVKRWYKNGELHRVDGPAIVYTNATKEWWADRNEWWINGCRRKKIYN